MNISTISIITRDYSTNLHATKHSLAADNYDVRIHSPVPSTFTVLFRYQVPLYVNPHFIVCFHTLHATKVLKFSFQSDAFYSLGEQMLGLQELQKWRA
jgi:hypothetical protein